MAKNITLKEEYGNDVVYPKTTVSQVIGLESTLNNLLRSSTNTETLSNYNFGSVEPLAAGTYIVKNPTNSPFENEDGVLKVIKTSDNTTIQTWNGKKYIGYREFGTFNPLEAGVEAVTVSVYDETTETFSDPVQINTSISNDYNELGIKFTYEQRDTINFNSGKIMWLYPGKTYKLSGVLIDCQIRIGYLSSWYKDGTTEFNAKNFDKASDNCETTTLILNNFYQKLNQNIEYDADDADSWEAAIGEYGSLIMSDIAGKPDINNRRGKLVINLAEGTKNYLVREIASTMDTANNKWGVIYSDQDLEISGLGFLGIADGQDNDHLLGCHAIKAKGNLQISDAPHIVGRAYHDLIHGNDGVYINNGYFQALYCNDILGTDTSLGDQAIGKIRLYNGLFDIRECYGTFIQADDTIVYPGVRVTFNTIGEGLFLQCAEGCYKGEITKKGQISNFGIIDYNTHTYTLYEPSGVKLDAAAFERYIEDVDSVIVYNEKTWKNQSKFDDAIASSDESKKPYILVNDEYILVEAGHPYNPDNETYYTQSSGAGIKIIYNGVEKDIPSSKTVFNMPGIIVYDGFTVTPDANYSYFESNRNTHFAGLVNSASEPDGGWNYNLEFSYTPAITEITDELSPASAAAYTLVPSIGAQFETVDFTYSGTVNGGVWNIGVTEQKLTEYKNDVDYLLTCIKGMLVPPKEIDIIDIVNASYDIITATYTTEGVVNTRSDELINEGNDINAGSIINGKIIPNKIKAGGYLFTSKTALEPTIHLNVGEAILVKANLLPDNATNYAMKWSVVGINDWVSIARLVTDDTMGCYIRGLQPGSEDIVVSAKALDKNNNKIKLTLHFVVDEVEE